MKFILLDNNIFLIIYPYYRDLVNNRNNINLFILFLISINQKNNCSTAQIFDINLCKFFNISSFEISTWNAHSYIFQ